MGRSLVFPLVVLAIVFAGIAQAESATRPNPEVLQAALVRAAVHSYAVNGYFPPSAEYIAENFGVHLDTRRFIVHYYAFATNILPEIRVFCRG